MATMANIDTYFSQRIDDPNHDEVDAISGSGDMLTWLNRVVDDAARVTDCLQSTESLSVNAEATATSTLTNLLRIISVADRTTKLVYKSIAREEYAGYYDLIKNKSAGGIYVFSLFGYTTANLKLYVLPVPSTKTLTIEHSEYPAVLTYGAGTRPPGLLDDYTTMIIEGMATLYYQTTGDTEREQAAFGTYVGWLQRLAGEVGTNPVIDGKMSSLYREPEVVR